MGNNVAAAARHWRQTPGPCATAQAVQPGERARPWPNARASNCARFRPARSSRFWTAAISPAEAWALPGPVVFHTEAPRCTATDRGFGCWYRSVYVADAQDARERPPGLLAQEAVNPASVMKLVTTLPRWICWGPPSPGTRRCMSMAWCRAAASRATIQGQGDPSWCWSGCGCCCGACRAQGIQVIVGDIVLDRSAFAVPAHDPGRLTASRCAPTTRRRMRCCSTTSRWS